MRLITLIASHLDGKPRLHHFLKLIKSINDQIDYFDEIDVRISISMDESLNAADVNALLNTTNKLAFKIYNHDNKKSQFEHYEFLCSQIKEYDSDDTWILFSDDDDEWAQIRLAAYHYMINRIMEKKLEYDMTTSICYTNEKSQMASTYIGNYTDYCVKLKYLRIFFENTNPEQLQNKYCDCYFVKFICTYGLGQLKRAFCATDDILYHWIKRDSSSQKKWSFEDAIRNNLDLYIAQYTRPNAKDWLKFCFLYCDEKLKLDGHVTDDAKKFMVKIYLDNYENHIFNKTIEYHNDICHEPECCECN